MPFQFQPYQPDTGTIAELLLRGGRSQADALRQVAAARANATMQSGQAWSGAANTIGAAFGAVPGQMQQMQDDAQRREMNTLQVNAARRGEADVTALDTAFGQGTSREDILNRLPGHLRPTVEKQFQDADERALKARELKDKAAEAERDYLGALAASVKAHDYDLTAAGIALQHAKDQGYDVDRIGQQLSQNPDSIKWIVDGMIAESPEQVKLQQAAETITNTAARDKAAADARAATAAATAARDAAAAKDREADNTRADAQLNVSKGLLSVAQQNANTNQQRYTTTGLTAEMDPQYRNALESAILGIPGTRRGSIVNQANRLWAEGNTEELKRTIQEAAIATENVDVKNQIRGRQATMASLADTKAILGELQQKGVPTGWLTGNVEDLVRKLGKTTNPEYVALGNRLMGTLINYRRAATGVAFSEKEAADYARMFPNYRNDLPVNLALIQGLERELKTYDRAYWEAKLGKGGSALVGAVPGGAAPGGAQNDPDGIR